MRLIVDRIENGIITVEMPDRGAAELLQALCPEAKEGDIIEIRVAHEQTRKREESIQKKMDNLFI